MFLKRKETCYPLHGGREAHHSSIVFPALHELPQKASCSWPRLQLWNLRPGSKCCQKIGHRGARAREYPSFPSSGWDEMLWWECIHGDEGLFQSTVQEFSQSLQGWQGRNLIQLVTCSPEHRENACLPACQCPAHLLPSSVTQDPSPENNAAAVGWVSPHGFPYEDKHLWKCPHD